MAIIFQCKCGRPLRAGVEAVGKKTKCPHCGALLTIPGGGPKPEPVVVAVTAAAASAGIAASVPADVDEDPMAPKLDWSSVEAGPTRPQPGAGADASKVGNPMIQVDAAMAGSLVVDVPRTQDGSKQYRVLGQKDQGFSGKFNPGKLEEILNAYAQRGWGLKSAVTVNIPGHGGMPGHEELVVILER